MSVSTNGQVRANSLTATISSSTTGRAVFGCHLFLPTGMTLGSVTAWMSITSTSTNARAYCNSARTHFTRFNDGTDQSNNTGFTLPFDTWTPVLCLIGPFDGGSTGTNIGWQNGSKNTDNDSTNSVSETFTQIRVGAEDSNANDISSFSDGSIAEAFFVGGISEANADTIASEMITLTPDAFSISVDNYWPLLSNGTASIGGNDLSSGGSPVFDSGNHPSLSGGGGGAAPPIIIFL